MGFEVTGTAIVTRKALRRARRGVPWLAGDDIVRYDGDGGPFVDLVDETSLPMGTAVYDTGGKARIRLLSSARTRDPVALLHTRLERAVARRSADLDGEDAGRLCHGEADGVPGVFVDRFGNGLLVSVDAQPMIAVARELLGPLVARTAAGVVALTTDDDLPEQTRLVHGASSDVRFVHGRLEMKVDLLTPGARTLSADLAKQRALRRWARGRTLDLHAGFGGFGLQLAEGGAREVVLVDDDAALSRTILDDARHNQIDSRVVREAGEPLGWLRAHAEEGKSFDVVVCHPPLLRDDDREAADKRASEYAALCLRLLDEGGVLATQASSRALSDDDHALVLQDAAARSRKRLQILARLGPGPDHPVLAGVPSPPSLLVARVLATA